MGSQAAPRRPPGSVVPRGRQMRRAVCLDPGGKRPYWVHETDAEIAKLADFDVAGHLARSHLGARRAGLLCHLVAPIGGLAANHASVFSLAPDDMVVVVAWPGDPRRDLHLDPRTRPSATTSPTWHRRWQPGDRRRLC